MLIIHKFPSKCPQLPRTYLKPFSLIVTYNPITLQALSMGGGVTPPPPVTDRGLREEILAGRIFGVFGVLADF